MTKRIRIVPDNDYQWNYGDDVKIAYFAKSRHCLGTEAVTPERMAEIRDGEIREYLLTPADFGLDTYPVSAIQGGEPEENRAITAAILEGRGSPAHNAAIAANVAPLLVMAGEAPDFRQAAARVLAVLASGQAALLARDLATLSHQEA